MENVAFYIAVYLLASIPFGYILALKFAKVDIKNEGSGNIGATNVLRVVKEKDEALGKKLGAITLFLDAIKGAVVLLIAMAFDVNESVLWTIAVLAVMGHCFSIFLSFEGGKGVATAIGVLAVMMPYSAIVAIIIWAFVGKILKISSLSSIIALVGFLISSYIIYPEVEGIGSHSPVWLISIIVFYKHIPNIIRLFNGEEKRV
ncbi:Acyl-phosphate:glycerol-3-phosphate O-acyltransferase PlsY [hydrothermal vent metagenome]|uniref:Acyl-phosphate:glycerol-3-phosphate O-acyltransferase PlsY n=1 Tax=hydrothermal vent metagenome TaxID=652676 RepID=A0A1W1EKJ6_9ZZZZ